jgi:hypothetical protein
MTTMSAPMSGGAYPVTLEVDQAAPQDRLSVLLRLIYAIPQFIALILVGIGLGIVTLIAWIVILINGSYPEGMLRFAIGANRLSNRVIGYIFLLTDKYPPFSLDDDPAYPVRFAAVEQVAGRNRLTTLLRIIMAIPQLIIIGVLRYAAGVVVLIAWVAALFTGSVPEGLHSFLAGFCRWQARVSAYVMLLTDEYPPFSLT